MPNRRGTLVAPRRSSRLLKQGVKLIFAQPSREEVAVWLVLHLGERGVEIRRGDEGCDRIIVGVILQRLELLAGSDANRDAKRGAADIGRVDLCEYLEVRLLEENLLPLL